MANGKSTQTLPEGFVPDTPQNLPAGFVPDNAPANDPLVTGEGMIRNAQDQAHGQAIAALNEAHGPGILGTEHGGESSANQDARMKAAWGSGPSLRPTLNPQVRPDLVPTDMPESVSLAGKIPSIAGALSMFTPAVAAAPIRTLGTIAGGTAGNLAGQAAGDIFDLSPENRQSASDALSVIGGYGGYKAGGPLERIAGTPRLLPRVANEAVSKISPTLADTVFPDVDKQYNARAESLMNRGEEQSKLDAAHESRLRETETARQKELAANERLKEQDARARMGRKVDEPEQVDDVAQAVKQGIASRIPTTMPKAATEVDPVLQAVREGRASRLPTKMPLPKIEPAQVDDLTQAVREGRASRIPTRMPPAKTQAGALPAVSAYSDVPREMTSTGSEGTAARWTNERVLELAGQGNRTAIEQATRRGLPLPPNARYVMGSADYPRAVYNPRETTTFEPEGVDIGNRARVPATSRARIVVPGGDYPGPRTERTPGALGEIPGLKPRMTPVRQGEGTSAVNLVTEQAPKTNRSQVMMSTAHEISRNQAILDNPRATPEERASAANMIEHLKTQR